MTWRDIGSLERIRDWTGPYLYLLKVISDNGHENLLTSEGSKQRLAEYLREHAQYLVRTLKDILAYV